MSGNPVALQAAIDCARPGGRVVVASWYSKAAELTLGTAFHRSHVTLVASQVSEVPGAAAATWSKARRFGAAWSLVEALRPSALLAQPGGCAGLVVPLGGIGGAYEALDAGTALTATVDYGNRAMGDIHTADGETQQSRL